MIPDIDIWRAAIDRAAITISKPHATPGLFQR
jgi:hypothetical protein